MSREIKKKNEPKNRDVNKIVHHSAEPLLGISHKCFFFVAMDCVITWLCRDNTKSVDSHMSVTQSSAYSLQTWLA